MSQEQPNAAKNEFDVERLLRVVRSHMTPKQWQKLCDARDVLTRHDLENAYDTLRSTYDNVICESPSLPRLTPLTAKVRTLGKRRAKRSHPSWDELSRCMQSIYALGGYLSDERLAKCWEWNTYARKMYNLCSALHPSLHDLLYELDGDSVRNSKATLTPFPESKSGIRSITEPSLLYNPRTKEEIKSINSLISKTRTTCFNARQNMHEVSPVLQSQGMHREVLLLYELADYTQLLHDQLCPFNHSMSHSIRDERTAVLDVVVEQLRREYVEATGLTDKFDNGTPMSKTSAIDTTTGCFFAIALSLVRSLGLNVSHRRMRESISRVTSKESDISLMYKLVEVLCHKQFDRHQIRSRHERAMRQEVMLKHDLELLHSDLKGEVSTSELADRLMETVRHMRLNFEGIPMTSELLEWTIESHYEYREELSLNAN